MKPLDRAAAGRSIPPQLLFAAMALIWGLTWIAIKTGVAAVPPLFFAGTRFVAAGLLLLAWSRFAGGSAGVRRSVQREDWPKLLVATLLMIVATYALLFWGTAHVASGLASVINLALT